MGTIPNAYEYWIQIPKALASPGMLVWQPGYCSPGRKLEDHFLVNLAGQEEVPKVTATGVPPVSGPTDRAMKEAQSQSCKQAL